MENKDFFNQLNQINVNDKTEDKNGLTYLSWAWAWAEFKKVCPDANYSIDKGQDGKFVYGDSELGYMVRTEVTVNGLTHEMWLPVMDNRNKTLLAPTMFDINKTIMRCLTKNLAMFGLGLYIYAGEDLPETPFEPATEEQIKKIQELNINVPNLLKWAGVQGITQLSKEKAEIAIRKKVQANENQV